MGMRPATVNEGSPRRVDNAPELAQNPVFNELVEILNANEATLIDRAGKRNTLDYLPATQFLGNRLKKPLSMAQTLDVLEASTASSVLGWRLNELNLAFSQIINSSIRRILDESESRGLLPAQSLIVIGRRVYRPDFEHGVPTLDEKYQSPEHQLGIKNNYHRERIDKDFIRRIGNICTASSQETQDYTYRIYSLAKGETLPDLSSFSPSLLANTKPDKIKDVGRTIDIMGKLSIDKVAEATAEYWQDKTLTVFMQLLSRYRTRSNNAAVLFDSLNKSFTQTGAISPYGVIDAADGVRIKMKQGKLTNHARRPLFNLPEAIDELVTLIIRHGLNDFSPEEVNSIQLFGQLLADTVRLSQFIINTKKQLKSDEPKNGQKPTVTFTSFYNNLDSVQSWQKTASEAAPKK